MTSVTVTKIALVGVVAGVTMSGGAVAAMPQTAAASHDVSSQAAELAYGNLAANFERWTQLPADWDGEGGQPLSRAVATNAQSVMALVRVHAIPCPQVYIAGDGETGMRWETERGFASVSFLPDLSFVAFVHRPGQPPYTLDQLLQPDGVLAIGDLFEHIKQVA